MSFRTGLSRSLGGQDGSLIDANVLSLCGGATCLLRLSHRLRGISAKLE